MNHNATNPRMDFSLDYDPMNFINDTVKSAIEEGVQEMVDRELSLMIQRRWLQEAGGGSH